MEATHNLILQEDLGETHYMPMEAPHVMTQVDVSQLHKQSLLRLVEALVETPQVKTAATVVLNVCLYTIHILYMCVGTII